ncbi:MAG: DnaA/Hda family protein [Alphaproteobacteria bacterium]
MIEQLVFDLPHRQALGAGDFFLAPCNRDAVGWLDRWPDWPAPALIIHGPAGSGKTHMAEVWRARSGARVVRNTDIAAQPLAAFDDGGKCWIVDGVAPGFEETPFLHFYNAVAERGGHLLITSRSAPSRWSLALPDLRSRLTAAPAVAVGRPDDTLLAAVLVKLFDDRQLPVGPDVLTYLLARMERSFSAMHALVAALDRQALAEQKKVTVPMARNILTKFSKQKDGD